MELPKPFKSSFEQTLTSSVIACIPLVGACESAGALKWLMALAQHCSKRSAAPALVAKGLALLERAATCLRERADLYQQLLRARFVFMRISVMTNIQSSISLLLNSY